MQTDLPTIATQVKARRSQLGITQDELADRAKAAGADISSATVRNVEQGITRQLQGRTKRALAAGLDVPVATVDAWAKGATPAVPAVPAVDRPRPNGIEVPEDVLRKLVQDEVRQLAGGGTRSPTFDDVLAGMTKEDRETAVRLFQRLIDAIDDLADEA